MKNIVLIFIFQFLINCSVSNDPMAPNSQNIRYLITEGKALWEQRSDTSAMSRAKYFIGLAYKENNLDSELAPLIGEMNYTRAYFLEADPEKRDSIFLVGSQICKKSIYTNHDFLKILNQTQGDSITRLFNALNNAPKSIVPHLYWWAVNYLHYLNNRPVIERINERELLEIIMNRVLALEPSFHHSGPYRFFGLLYTRIPGLKLNQSETYFNQSLASNREFLGNAVLMAEFYHQKAGNREKFHKTLQDVVNYDIAQYPELLTDNLFFQNKAAKLLEIESSLFE